MKVHEAFLPVTVPAQELDQPLFTPHRILAYLNEGILEDNHASVEESFWVIGMTHERRPLIRQRIKLGTLVAARVHVREVFQVAMQAGAAAVACVRVQYSNAIQPGLADGRLLWNLQEAAKYLEILFVDYLITELDGCAFYAYSQHRRDRD